MNTERKIKLVDWYELRRRHLADTCRKILNQIPEKAKAIGITNQFITKLEALKGEKNNE